MCKWFICVDITIFGDLWNVTFVKSLNEHLGTNLHWSIVIFKKILFINSLSVVWAKRFGVSLFNVIFVLKEKGEITLLLTCINFYWPRIEYTRFPRVSSYLIRHWFWECVYRHNLSDVGFESVSIVIAYHMLVLRVCVSSKLTRHRFWELVYHHNLPDVGSESLCIIITYQTLVLRVCVSS